MQTTISALLKYLCEIAGDTAAIEWTPPVPAFGDPTKAQVATLGLNPSDREFVDLYGRELDGPNRRFPTLRSFGLGSWYEATDVHIDEIVAACRSYFTHNPYHRWFARLDFLLQDTSTSYYSSIGHATHLDLVPYATARKWAELSRREKDLLTDCSRDALGGILRAATVDLIVLNGMSVV